MGAASTTPWKASNARITTRAIAHVTDASWCISQVQLSTSDSDLSRHRARSDRAKTVVSARCNQSARDWKLPCELRLQILQCSSKSISRPMLGSTANKARCRCRFGLRMVSKVSSSKDDSHLSTRPQLRVLPKISRCKHHNRQSKSGQLSTRNHLGNSRTACGLPPLCPSQIWQLRDLLKPSSSISIRSRSHRQTHQRVLEIKVSNS
jgi:hypothetical protein